MSSLFEKLKGRLGETSMKLFPDGTKNDLITSERERLAEGQSSRGGSDALLLVTSNPHQHHCKLLEVRGGSVSHLYFWAFVLLIK